MKMFYLFFGVMARCVIARFSKWLGELWVSVKDILKRLIGTIYKILGNKLEISIVKFNIIN